MNTPESIQMGRSRTLAARCNYQALTILSEQEDGTMLFSDLKGKLQERLDLDEWGLYVYPKTGEVRWVVNLHYYSIDLVKSGYLIKNKGEWCITDAGREALAQFKDNPTKLFEHTHRIYQEWERNNKSQKVADDEEELLTTEIPSTVVLETIKQQASEDLRHYIEQRTAWEFQDMAAALLRAMGYYTPFVAPKGKDGGVDVIAYSDPLGASRPILKVQVKHYGNDNPVSTEVVRSIIGVAHGDTPIVITSGKYTESAKAEARQNNVRLIDGSEFVALWIEYYSKMDEEDKSLMPIEPVYFIKRPE